MITVTKVFKADAAHVLPDHNGKCANLHGHTYTYEITVGRGEGPALHSDGSDRGMLVDFSDLTVYWEKSIKPFVDHVSLNESLGIYPTAEVIALWVATNMAPFCLSNGVSLVSVRVHEGPDSFATFTSDCQESPEL